MVAGIVYGMPFAFFLIVPRRIFADRGFFKALYYRYLPIAPAPCYPPVQEKGKQDSYAFLYRICPMQSLRCNGSIAVPKG
jgi:hypothetical protein